MTKKALAIWNESRGIWESPEGSIDLFSAHSEPYSATWPASGILRRGTAFELPTSAHLIDANAYSSSPSPTTDVLPTPTTSESKGAAHTGAGAPNLRTVVADELFPTPRASRGASTTEVAYALGGERTDAHRPQGEVFLPTPTAALASGGQTSRSGDRKGEPLLAGIVEDLLPTPVTEPHTGNGHARNLSAEVLLPTPTAMNPNDSEDPEAWQARKDHHASKDEGATRAGMPLGIAVKLLPTPVAADKDNSKRNTVSPGEGKTSHAGETLTDAIDLLPTPLASDGEKGGPNQRGGAGDLRLSSAVHFRDDALLPTPLTTDNKGFGPADLERDTVQLRAIAHFLPTPTTQETHSGPSQMNRNTVPLNAEVLLLPTPVAAEGYKGTTRQGVDQKSMTGQVWLTNVAHDLALERDWGKYLPAIVRATVVSRRRPPAPTNPDGKNGNERLAAQFVEWMMMLPEGRVTAHGLSRNKALERLGNGVVPIQAATAVSLGLRRLLLMRRGEL